MESQLVTFKRFNDLALANIFTDLLDEHEIVYEVEEQNASFDPAFRYGNETKEYAVKINGEDFTRVTKLLNDNAAEDIDGVEKDYYLFAFSDEELIDILAKADEWSPFDYQLARKILTERGVNINDNLLAELEAKRIEELKVPESTQNVWIIVGYIFAFAGGILGILMGWYLATGKKTLPDGNRVYYYSDNDRKHGKRIFYISVIVFALSLFYKFYLAYTDSNY